MAGIVPLFAQQENDSVKGQIRLNKDAVRMIQFDFNAPQKEHSQPQSAPLDKKWMSFKTEVRMPRSLTDTTAVRKPTGYVRAEPYTIWTRYGEDPVFDVLVYGRPAKKQVYWKLQPYVSSREEEYGHTLPPSMGRMYDLFSGGGNPMGAGVVAYMDFDKILFENFTARGRAIRHNRTHATAWKTYRDYVPTREDSLKFPTFGRDLKLWAVDTVSQASPVLPDAAKKSVTQAAAPPDPKKPAGQAAGSEGSMEDIYRRMRKQQQADSLRWKEFFRKDKVRQNVYDVEREIRRMKEK